MAFNGNIKFKGVSSKTFPLTITEPPQVSHASLIHANEYTIPGRNGELYSTATYRESAEISVKMALVPTGSGNSAYQTALRQVRQWLQGTGKLILGDVTDSYYEVQKVVIATDNRVILRYGTLEAKFTVYPYEFLNSGDDATTSYSTITNSGDVSHPLYKITGAGSGVLTVNNKTMNFTNADTTYIDVRRQIAYDGSNNSRNKYLTGDYNNLVLKHGTNTISISSGFTLVVYTKWGYNL